jgi:hypothetical protein
MSSSTNRYLTYRIVSFVIEYPLVIFIDKKAYITVIRNVNQTYKVTRRNKLKSMLAKIISMSFIDQYFIKIEFSVRLSG